MVFDCKVGLKKYDFSTSHYDTKPALLISLTRCNILHEVRIGSGHS